jgi:hypothetical protein
VPVHKTSVTCNAKGMGPRRFDMLGPSCYIRELQVALGAVNVCFEKTGAHGSCERVAKDV